MFNKIRTRVANPKVQVALVSAVLIILANLGLVDAVQSDKILSLVNVILGTGLAVGVLGDPESHIEK
jgi:uncharacterized membrane protein